MVLLYFILSLPITALVHEYAHVLMAKLLVGVSHYSIKVYPHRHEIYGLVGGIASLHYQREATPTESAWVAFAPRLHNSFFLALMPLAKESHTFVALLVFMLGAYDMGKSAVLRDPDLKQYAPLIGCSEDAVVKGQLFLVGLGCLIAYLA